MRLKTIVNKCCHFKGFVTGNGRFDEKGKSIIVEINPRKNSRPICSGCEKKAPGYDRLPSRLFEFIPFWGFHVYFEYAMRRVECPRCQAVLVEKVPWADGKNHLTHYYCKYLASWAKEISWKRVAERFRTSWETVRRAVENIVEFGLKHRNIEDVSALGVDEIQWHSGHDYLTLVYQIDEGCRRLLWVGEERTKKTLRKFFSDFRLLNETFAEKIKVICCF